MNITQFIKLKLIIYEPLFNFAFQSSNGWMELVKGLTSWNSFITIIKIPHKHEYHILMEQHVWCFKIKPNNNSVKSIHAFCGLATSQQNIPTLIGP